MTLTHMAIDEAAEVVGVATATIRSWVMRGYVAPIQRPAKPLRFDELAIARCAVDRMSAAEHARLDQIWQRVLDTEAQLQRSLNGAPMPTRHLWSVGIANSGGQP